MHKLSVVLLTALSLVGCAEPLGVVSENGQQSTLRRKQRCLAPRWSGCSRNRSLEAAQNGEFLAEYMRLILAIMPMVITPFF